MKKTFFFFACALVIGIVYFQTRDQDTYEHLAKQSDQNPISRRPTSLQDKTPLAAPKTKKKKDTDSITKKLDKENILECYQKHCPSIDDSDPRAYEINLGFALQKEVKLIRDNLSNNDLSEQDEKFLLEALEIPNGHVQSEAIAVLEKLPRSPVYFQSLIKALNISDYDSVLAGKALSVLNKYYEDPKYKADVLAYLEKQLTYGPLKTSETLAKDIDRFLDDESYQKIQQIYHSTPKGHNVKKYLDAALKNHKLQSTGG